VCVARIMITSTKGNTMQVAIWNNDKVEGETYAEVQENEKEEKGTVSSVLTLPTNSMYVLKDILEAVYNETDISLKWEIVGDVAPVTLPKVTDLPVPNFINVERNNRNAAIEFINGSLARAILSKMNSTNVRPKDGKFHTSMKDPDVSKEVLVIVKEMAKVLGYTLSDSHDGGGMFYVLAIQWQIDLDTLED